MKNLLILNILLILFASLVIFALASQYVVLYYISSIGFVSLSLWIINLLDIKTEEVVKCE